MKLEEGKKYVDRRGRVFGPMVKCSKYFGEQQGHATWHDDGSIMSGEVWHMDLIAEHVEICPMCDNPCVQGGVACKECGEFAVEYAGCPKESPDDWVTQDRVEYRKGIDQRRWVCLETKKTVVDWQFTENQIADGGPAVHGHCGKTVRLELRCRRKDLPAFAVPPLPERTPVTLWVPERGLQEGGDWPVRVSFRGEKPTGIGSWVKVGVGPDGFFVEGGV